jgi:DNA-binding LytR/AlgR family response regulator
MNAIEKIERKESLTLSKMDEKKNNGEVQNLKSEEVTPQIKPYIFVKSGKSYKKIPYAQIQYIKASGAYCDIVLQGRSFTISASLNRVLEQLDTLDIVRCHRSFAVNVDMISSFDDTTIRLDCKDERITLPISMTYRSEMMEVLPRLKSC